MNRITCPECGATINFNEADYSAILQQVQNDELKSQVQPAWVCFFGGLYMF